MGSPQLTAIIERVRVDAGRLPGLRTSALVWWVVRSRDGLRPDAVEAVGQSEHLGDERFEVIARFDRGGWESGGFEAICEGPARQQSCGVARVPTDEAVGEVVVTDSV